MTTNDYRPVACDAYDHIEILAVRRTEVEITVCGIGGVQAVVAGKVLDTSIHDGAEYLVLESIDSTQELRLDHIQRIYDPASSFEWRQKTDTF